MINKRFTGYYSDYTNGARRVCNAGLFRDYLPIHEALRKQVEADEFNGSFYPLYGVRIKVIDGVIYPWFKTGIDDFKVSKKPFTGMTLDEVYYFEEYFWKFYDLGLGGWGVEPEFAPGVNNSDLSYYDVYAFGSNIHDELSHAYAYKTHYYTPGKAYRARVPKYRIRYMEEEGKPRVAFYNSYRSSIQYMKGVKVFLTPAQMKAFTAYFEVFLKETGSEWRGRKRSGKEQNK